MAIRNFFVSILLLPIAFSSCQPAVPESVVQDSSDRAWWKEAIVYQVYPRSFKDSDGDGIGDLRGIISRLDYIKSLGVNTVWLNPIYRSPNDDNGYDVSDYRNIMKDFGTMADFDSLVSGMHRRGLKLVMDMVFNHSSDEHEWFRQSRSSRNNPYRNYYHWWNAERGKPPYRYSLFDINHDAWKYDSLTNAYYLHYFSRKQPDLNWENPQVRKELYDIMKFWADKGIDGFRLDAFQFAAKDTSWPAFPQGYENHFALYYAMVPGLHKYLQEMNREVFSRYPVMSVAEGAGNSLQDAHDLVDGDRKELDIAYAFDGVDLAGLNGYDFMAFKKVFTKWDSAFSKKGWLAIFLSNHDQARLVSRFGNDSPPFRAHSSQMLSTFLLTMRGTPFIYNGDELGMSNAYFDKPEDYRDVQTLNEYKHQMQTGGDMKLTLKKMQAGSRDNGRTPIQWDGSANAGFSTGNPWIRVNPNYLQVNVSLEEKDSNSCLNYFRKLTKLRNENKTLVYGSYKILDEENPSVYAYLREGGGERFLVLLNFTDKPASAHTGMESGKYVLGNYNGPSPDGMLRPYEAQIYRLGP